jgi:disulfide bond formation protein DsbB
MLMLTLLTPFRAAVLVLLIATVTIVGAWIFQWAGYLPCDLCLKQRWAYYAGVPLAVVAVLLTRSPGNGLARLLLVMLAIIFAASAVFGAYHAGVEWGFWAGPAGCTGTVPQHAGSMADFRQQLKTVQIVRCDVVALRILGVSLAGWNFVISIALAAIAVKPVLSRDN